MYICMCVCLLLPFRCVMYASNWQHFGPMVVLVWLHFTLPHDHHYADVSEGIELIEYMSGTFWRCVSKIEPILSITSHAIYGAVCTQLIQLSYDDCENMFTLFYHHHEIGRMTHSILFRVRSWKNGMRWRSVYIHIYIYIYGFICISLHFLSYKCSQITKTRQTRFTGIWVCEIFLW